ncbi:septum site-determining protein Ssd [Georgenia satyanarayanai]|uniref:septum site-determining protein Ssd n=1 Tax=Georgenia satyanarayanai TaxID=860221 RepID=UPI001264C42D|nr:septum site-determining protein Ssd [Georgenia satyanarayanai]
MESAARAVLRSGDRHVVERVRRLCVLAGVELEVCQPGSDPPATAALLIDDTADPTGPPWRGTATAGEVLELGDGGLHLPADAEVVLDALSRAAAPRRARVVGVVGAVGGVGASALAAVLARLAVAAGWTTALVDLDPAGGGLEVLLGIEHDAGPRWCDVLAERGGFPPDRLMAALPQWHGARVLSSDVRGGVPGAHPVALEAVGALTRAADAVLLDLPRAVLAPGAAAEWSALCHETVLLTACDTRAAAAAAAAVNVLGEVRLVVRGPAAGTLLPEDVADVCGRPLAAVLRPERAFTAAVERGLSPGDQRRGPLVATGRRLLRTVGLAS